MGDRLEEMKRALILDGEWEGIEAPYGEALILKEVFDDGIYDNLGLGPGDRVLDLGAHVGCFSVLALRAGVDRLWAVEPFPPNVRCLERNLRRNCGGGSGWSVFQAAIGACDGETVFRIGRGSAFSFGTVPKGRGRAALEIPVPVVALGALLADLRPTVLKVDVEGAEYDSLLPLLRENVLALHDVGVTRVTGEFHVNTEEMFERAVELAGLLEDGGWVRRRKALPKSAGGWPWVNSWVRHE